MTGPSVRNGADPNITLFVVAGDWVHGVRVPIANLVGLTTFATTKDWAPAVFMDDYRLGENFVREHYVAADYDDGSVTVASAIAVAKESGYRLAIMTTRSHGKPKNGEPACDRLRIVAETDRPITTKEEHLATWRALCDLFGGNPDEQAKDASRYFYASPGHVYCAAEGKPFPVVQPEPVSLPVCRDPRIAVSDAWVEAAFRGEVDRMRSATAGQRNGTLNRCAFALAQVSAGGGDGRPTREEAEAALTEAALEVGLGEHEIRATFKSGWDAGLKEPRWPANRTPAPLIAIRTATIDTPVIMTDAPLILAPLDASVLRPEESISGHRALTQLGNAERLVDLHGDKFRFCDQLGCFFTWDGRRWAEDIESSLIRELALKTVRGVYAEAAEVTDRKDAETLAKHAVRSEANMQIAGMLQLVRSLRRIELEAFDPDPLLLNVANGTVDLRTGALRRHARGDLLTRLTRARYEPGAAAPRWFAFLEQIFAGDEQLIGFVQRLLGHSLTGESTEHVLPVLYGTGANGKSTLLGVVQEVLGDYAVQLPSNFLLVKRHEPHPEAVARLRGRRFACAVEVPEGSRFDESLVKHLTGGDAITARGMYQSSYQFRPSHTVFLAVNDKPQVHGMDEAIWRRLVTVPFKVQIPEPQRDRDLKRKLREEAAGILSWMVEGCLQWQTEGLCPPSSVVEASAEYRAEMDSVARFLAEKCVLTPDGVTRKSDLRRAYEAFCQEENIVPRNPKKWAERLRKAGLRDGKFGVESARVWDGVRLITANVNTE